MEVSCDLIMELDSVINFYVDDLNYVATVYVDVKEKEG